MASRTGNCIRNVWWADTWWLKVDRIIGWRFGRWIKWFRTPCCSRLFKFHSFESEIIDFLVATCYWLVEGIYLVLTRLLWSLIENRCVKRGEIFSLLRHVSCHREISFLIVRFDDWIAVFDRFEFFRFLVILTRSRFFWNVWLLIFL